ncbi:MAG: 2-C-methyl-D-erythritol 2,4-cyclodiphosphate synthase [Arsenophonus sp.]
MRIGHGFDVHKFSEGKSIIICGVKIPSKLGLMAHSDGDVALHALIDSILGAAALGDIGKLFPDIDISLKDINSRLLLRQAYSQVIKKGYCISNVDITIITQIPKIFPYITDMYKNISNDLSCSIDNINIKATTTEKLGFIGRKEGIACEAVTLLINNNN